VPFLHDLRWYFFFPVVVWLALVRGSAGEAFPGIVCWMYMSELISYRFICCTGDCIEYSVCAASVAVSLVGKSRIGFVG